MKRSAPLCALAVLLLGTACAEDIVRVDTTPIVSISASETAGVEPLMVQFFSTVSGGNGELSFSWDFGDGETSTAANPRHEFAAAADAYAVTVTVTDEDGDLATSGVSIAAGTDDIPAAAVQATPQAGTAPLAVDFGCTPGGGNAPLTTLWRFGQGDGANTANATHTFLVPGVYVARCEVTDADGDVAGESLTITVGDAQAPTAALSASPVSGAAPLTVNFVAATAGGNGAITFDWAFGDEGTSDQQTVSHVFTDPGVYTALLEVTDEDGDSDVATVMIEVLAP